MTSLLTILGLLTLLHFLYRISSFLRPFLLHSSTLTARYLYPSPTTGAPAWALVTGASDGIGKQLAREFARLGFNVVLHGRNPSKLSGVKDELVKEFPERAFRVLVADAGCIACVNCCQDDDGDDDNNNEKDREKDKKKKKPKTVDFDAIVASLSDLHLTVLVNNAGGNPWRPVYQYMHEKPLEKYIASINLNAVFPLVLISKLLPQFLARGRGGGGGGQPRPSLIMNIGSLSDIGTPGLCAYSPCKSLLNTVTVGIGRELQMMRDITPPSLSPPTAANKKGNLEPEVEIIMIRVGEVCGTAYDKGSPSLFHPDANTMAKACLARVGCGRRIVEGYWPHAVQAAAVDLLPEWVADWAVWMHIRPRWEADAKMD